MTGEQAPVQPDTHVLPSVAPGWCNVRGIEPMSLSDWPGRTVFVLFVGGCNLHCPTCHNGDLAWRHTYLPRVKQHVVHELAAKRKRWYDGIVVSGGEPTSYRDLPLLLRDLKSTGLPIKLDTNGMRPDVVEILFHANLADEFYVDVKGPFAKYPQLTGKGVTAEQAAANIGRIFALARRAPERFVFRTTRVPFLTDDDIAEVRNLLPDGFTLTLQQYREPQSRDSGRTHAKADQETRRMPGDLVGGSHSACNPESAASHGDQGPDPFQEACA
ncbi:anaerobic ribonucleoside-triphosphate reductase activating protein [Oceanidesulfovibrio indonesiensis]|uniref:Anaerobic ribonucleoside-triphosphate reductase activating protein n=2 Tax=Oceanidesulfovibrio indonesiensis TaxID=54767 RepID=A0A7M3MB06_9BACT|nr:anaerobic ribonucleoside-triphosphate reductase activating protein [Oceanidesulfovibrio indonesiensis]